MSRSFGFPVDRSAILLFAAALGETNPIYYDEEYAAATPLGGLAAPPTFGAAANHWDPDHPLRGVRRIPPASRPVPGDAEGRDEGGEAGLSRLLHGEQRFEYHRPLRPGMELRVTTRRGRSWEKAGRRGGRLRFSETVREFRDTAGELVLTATSVGIVTEKAVDDG